MPSPAATAVATLALATMATCQILVPPLGGGKPTFPMASTKNVSALLASKNVTGLLQKGANKTRINVASFQNATLPKIKLASVVRKGGEGDLRGDSLFFFFPTPHHPHRTSNPPLTTP